MTDDCRTRRGNSAISTTLKRSIEIKPAVGRPMVDVTGHERSTYLHAEPLSSPTVKTFPMGL